MPAWTSPRGERPEDPDYVGPRGSDAYNAAVQRLHAWQAKNIARGVPMDMVVDKYDDMGNISHDWKQWTGQFEGTESARPMEYDQELWNIGNFQKNISKQEEGGGWWGDYHKDPTSGYYFNDPGNDYKSRTWYDEWGDLLPNAPGRGPEVEYDDRGRMYFVDRAKEAKAKPGETVYNAPGQEKKPPVAMPAPSPLMSQTASPTPNAYKPFWGASGSISMPNRGFSTMRPQQQKMDSFGSFADQRTQRPVKGGFSRGFY